MYRPARLAFAMLLLLIAAPWLAAVDVAVDPVSTDLVSVHPELNEAQADAIRGTGARGVTTWAMQGTGNPNINNGLGEINSVWVSDVISTSAGAVIITGSYRGDVVFGSIISPPDRAQRTAFIAQLDQWGGWTWFRHTARPGDSVGGIHAEEVTMGPAGVWICGWMYDTITIGNHSLTTGGLYFDGFVALYNISTDHWDVASNFGGPNHDMANSCAATSDGSLYVAGSHTGTAQLGPTSHQTEGGYDLFILMVDQMGAVTWSEAWGGTGDDNATGVVIDAVDNAYLIGHYRDNAQNWPNNTIMPAGRPYNSFISKVNAGGTFLWSRAISGGVQGDEVYATSVAYGNGDIYVAGYLTGEAEFRHGQTVAYSLLSNASAINAYVAAIDTSGSWVWASRSAGLAQSTQVVTDLAVGPLGTIAASGYLSDTNEFWTNGSFGTFDLRRGPGVESFVAGINPYGTWVWADGMGGQENDYGLGVAWIGLGHVVTVGRHCVTAQLGCGSQFGTVNISTATYFEGAGYIWAFKVDTDLDGIADLNDNCPLVNNTAQDNMDGDNSGDACDTDADGDGYDDWYDQCIGPAVNWNQSDWTLDRDGDGCNDLTEDADDDGDGVLDLVDDCDDLSTRHNWTSGLANDYDSDGCHDGDEDLDDDSDTVLDVNDDCPAYPFNRSWVSTAETDHDGDGCEDHDDDVDDDNDGVNDLDLADEALDQCPRGTLGWTSDSSTDQDSDGCQDDGEDFDDDGDGVQDFVDDCLDQSINWDSQPATDKDGDGCRDYDEDDDDDGDGLLDVDDDCTPGDIGWTSSPSTDVDGDGCRDAGEDQDDDGDMVEDDFDSCPGGKTGWESNAIEDADGDGCHDEDEDPDDDNDGFDDLIDVCPGTPLGAPVDGDGCSYEQGDDDDDGVLNSYDLCPNTASDPDYDSNHDGCTDDVDDDGILDDVDVCLNTPDGEQIDSQGCGYVTQQDSDGDGIRDVNDGCPGTSNQSVRDANSGYIWDDQFGCWTGDDDDDADDFANWMDQCPDSGSELIIENGCTELQMDDDGDGISNEADGCPNTATSAVADDNGCSRQQRAGPPDESWSTGAILGIIGLVVVLIIAGAAGVLIIAKGKKQASRDTRREARANAEVATSEFLDRIEDADATLQEDANLEDDPNYKVDETGTEWWLDDDRKWWYRTPEMDDWTEHPDE